MVPEQLKYTSEHEWVKIDGDTALIGITDHAQKELGDITFAEIPKKGGKVSKGDTVSTVESVKAASDVYAPVSGEITEVNESLEMSPEVINSDPYGGGWICRIKMSDAAEVDSLLGAEEYKNIAG